ncbi:oligosaccharide repeat unit polymerase [Sphaerotilus microaerophilus]|uniref:oligosaccharide repeat unit polymerase n=1 Tax=Sphaerotilus microaerophilus TaxID=2914710 RepID=UPI002072B5AC|nr:oligosaccharide repeat unit polymerase [Sphaerotilus sp. FB-5]
MTSHKKNSQVNGISRGSPRGPWLAAYILSNIIGLIVIVFSNQLIGDAEGKPLTSTTTAVAATLIICCAYLIILGPLFRNLNRINFSDKKNFTNGEGTSRRIGITMLVVQILFFAFNLYFGVNTAGSASTKTSTPLSIIWVAIPADYLFIVYYSLYRESKLFHANLVTWALSNATRGWSSFILIIIFFEYCRLHRSGRINYKIVLTGLAALITLYPLITAAKWAFRAAAGTDLDLIGVASQIELGAAADGYETLMSDGIVHLIGRLHLTSMLTTVIDLSEKLQNEYEQGAFAPFWKEGLPGIAYDLVFNGRKTIYIGTAITGYADLGNPETFGDWNSSISYVGWFFIAPQHAALYLAYTLLLCIISVYLTKRCNGNALTQDGLWLAWLLYLLPPWWGAFITYIQALIWMRIFQHLLTVQQRRTYAQINNH